HVHPEFHSDFTFTHPPCTGEFQFQDLSHGLSGNPLYWSWNFGDNQTSSVQHPLHLYNNPGDYIITLISTRDYGCADTAQVSVHVTPYPTCVFTLNLDTCEHTAGFENTSTGAV